MFRDVSASLSPVRLNYNIYTLFRHGLLSEKHNSEKDFLLKRLEQLLAGRPGLKPPLEGRKGWEQLLASKEGLEQLLAG